MGERKGADRLLSIVLLLLLGGNLYALAAKRSPVRRYLEGVRTHRATARALAANWSRIIHMSSRIDTLGVSASLVEFADYECPFCRRSAQALDTVFNNLGIGVVFLHVPLPFHANARPAARAAICAEKLGHFREMHHWLMTSAAWSTGNDWVGHARSAGIEDTVGFRHCLDSKDPDERLDADLALASQLGIEGTPTFFSSRRRYTGLLSRDSLVALVRP